jgi:hypothetical protein
LITTILAFIALTTTGCSAVELYHGNASATAEAEAGAAAATENPTVSALEGALADVRATQQALSASATESATVALSSTPTAAEDLFPLRASAETVVYGSVPIDSDRLNIIAALGFDADGQLLAATRAGEIYALPDSDGDGVADETSLIFADEEQQLGQVAGLIARGEALILLNGERLSLLTDADSDGRHETVTHLSGQLPADQSPLQASNGIVSAPDGRLFTVDIKSGEILQIVLRE